MSSGSRYSRFKNFRSRRDAGVERRSEDGADGNCTAGRVVGIAIVTEIAALYQDNRIYKKFN